MGAPRRRAKPKKRAEVRPPSQPLTVQGEWTIYVSFKREGSFVISFTAAHTVNDKMQVATRLPVLAMATLRHQLLCTHDSQWKRTGLPVNPQWETDSKVLVGGNFAKLREQYIQLLIANFNGVCKQHTLPVKMVLRNAKAPATKKTAAPVQKAPAKKTATPVKKIATKKTAKKAAPKKTAKKATRSPRRRYKR